MLTAVTVMVVKPITLIGDVDKELTSPEAIVITGSDTIPDGVMYVSLASDSIKLLKDTELILNMRYVVSIERLGKEKV
jgi:hypothetical protein